MTDQAEPLRRKVAALKARGYRVTAHKCYAARCRRQPVAIYVTRPVCDVHLERALSDDFPTRLGMLAALDLAIEGDRVIVSS